MFCEPNNSVPAYSVDLSAAVPPSISGQPISETNVLAGGYYTLSASATGTEPLKYQWTLNGNSISGATSSTLPLTNITFEAAGIYTLTVTNAFGTATSLPAYVGVSEAKRTAAAKSNWLKRPGELFCLTVDNSQRGLAYNPVSGNLLLVSRTPTNGVHVLNAATGAYIRSLDLTGVGGVTSSFFDINLIAVAEGGAVHVCDLTTGDDGFAIYRWANDSAGTVPTQVFAGRAGATRLGDTFSVEGRGLSTTLFAAARNGTQVAVFTTYDESYWYPTIVDVVDAPAGFAGLSLYATATNAFWAKSLGFPLRKVEFDLGLTSGSATNNIVATIGSGVDSICTIGVDETNGLVFGVGLATPDFLGVSDIYRMSTTNDVPAELDSEFFGADNANINGTGQVAVDLAGGRVFALDSNNGLLSITYAPPLRFSIVNGSLVLTWAGPSKLMRATDPTGPFTEVTNASSPYTNTASGPVFYRLQH